ncbi:MAG: hypothetical protein M3N29_07960 [Chloroflexota bacterium]|nr:hypothetical protein [Chloroflexota bacterium]
MIDVDRRDGAIVVNTARYELEVDAAEPLARLRWRAERPATQLMLLAELDSDGGLDSTLRTAAPRVERDSDGVTITLDAVSTVWQEKQVRLHCGDDELAFQASIAGTGRLTNVRLLGGLYTGNPRWGGGIFHSRWPARSLFVPSPDDPRRLLQPAAESATIGVVGGDMPGRGHWFFTPAPFLLAGSAGAVEDPTDGSGRPWETLELEAGVEAATFSELSYAASAGGFTIVLAYDGQTAVDGRFTSPRLVIRLVESVPYEAVAAHAARLRASGAAPGIERRPADWWRRPIFCGWGEQFRQWRLHGGHPTEYSRRENYDRWLALLADHGVAPGTVVIDDKWQTSYGRNEVDEERWPDLRGWIAERHARGQRVVLWFKAWDAEGLPAEACVVDRLGQRVAADPDSRAYQDILRASLASLLGSGALDADGLKVDFTAQTPSGPGLERTGPAWGVALLHRLLALVYRFAKEAKPDALVVTHTPNPLFADVTDMIRLNDLLRLRDPQPWAPAVAQMTHRARIAAAVDPGLLIDTDDWCMPSKREWRAYLEAKIRLGVPALYYATGIDHSGEPFDDQDYAAIRDAWSRWQSTGAAGRPA